MPELRRITAPGPSALAVLEVRGADAAGFLQSLGARRLPEPGGMKLATLDLGAGLREQALLVATRSGFEIQTHGNPLLVDAILARGPDTGGPAAEESHDWRRGLDLEGRILRIAREACARHALDLALFQIGEAGLLGCLRRLAAGHDVSDGLEACREALANAPLVQRQLRTPRVVLRGRVNAGKSTLFNLLVGQERVRTGPTPALTRDPIEQQILYRDRSLMLVDTAGEAEGLVDLDRLAGQQSRQEALRSDLVLWVHDSRGDEPVPAAGEGVLVVETHHALSDLAGSRLDLLQPDRDAIRSHVLDLLLRTLGMDTKAPLAPAPLDADMEAALRWVLSVRDPVAAAALFQSSPAIAGTKADEPEVDRGWASESTPGDEPGEARSDLD